MNGRFEETVRDGDVDEMRRLVRECGADPDAVVMSRGMTALHYACQQGDMHVIEYLVEEAHVDVEKEDEDGWRALHHASFEDKSSAVSYLVKTGGANVNAQSREGNTPSHLASSRGNVSIVVYLAEERHANVNLKDELGQTPLDRMAEWFDSHSYVVRYLLPRTLYIADYTLFKLWDVHDLLDIRSMMLEKFAVGEGLSVAFSRNPIHTLFSYFPFSSAEEFQDCIKLFPSSVLSLLDQHGRLPIHVALTSRDDALESPLVISALFEREPRMGLARDPITGLFPHEAAASLVADDDDDDSSWLNITYKMFRVNSQQILSLRNLS